MRPRARLIPAFPILAALLALAAASGCQSRSPVPSPSSLGDAEREFYVRRRIEDARAFRRQGRLEAAEHALRRGLAVDPEDPRLHRTLARVLEDLDRAEAAELHRRRALALDPPPPPPPEGPIDASSQGILVALLPPEIGNERADRVPASWPDGGIAETLESRLRVRLPESAVAHVAPETVAEARGWLLQRAPRALISLRVDRAYCDESIKDGEFAVAWLRLAAEAPGPASDGPETIREVVLDPQLPGGCKREALVRALERCLSRPAVRDALRAPASAEPRWSRPAIRALFPQIGRRIAEELRSGRARLASGRVAAAAEAFRRAARIDPEDPDVRAYLRETAITLAISRELSDSRGPDPGIDEDAGTLDPGFTPAQRAAAEASLAEERRRRRELMATLAVLDEDVRVPPAEALATLRSVRIRDDTAFGPRLARARAGRDVEARAAYAPDGSVIARYYFPGAADLPVVREDDTDGDDRPDRWIGYEGPARRDIWEDGRGLGLPDLHLVFASNGAPLERIELDLNVDGQPERIFYYSDGKLDAESRDTNGDGQPDRFDHFDASGNLELRREDLDGDGRIDVRTVYRGGKVVRRQLADPEPGAALPDDT